LGQQLQVVDFIIDDEDAAGKVYRVLVGRH
jgi:hypothetical protein